MPNILSGENCKIQLTFLFIYVLTELRAGQLQREQNYNEITNKQTKSRHE
jgi:hypothetical protein